MLLPCFCPYRPSIQGIQAVNLKGIFYHQERPIFQLSTISGGILSSPPSLRGYKITLLRKQTVYFPNLFVIFHAPSAHFSRDWFHMDKHSEANILIFLMNKANSLPFLQVSDFWSAVSLWTRNSPNKFTKCYLLSKQPHGRQCDGCPFVDMSSLDLMFSVHIGASGKESTLGFLKAFPRSSEESRPSICCACSCSNKVLPTLTHQPPSSPLFPPIWQLPFQRAMWAITFLLCSSLY